MLTQPSRLQKLAEIYQAELKLAPVEASQIGGIEDLPPKPVEDPGFLHGSGSAAWPTTPRTTSVTGTVVQ